MNINEKTLRIQDALLKGGLVYSERCSGKTWALCRILVDDANAVIVASFDAQRRNILQNFPELKGRVFLNSASTRRNLFGIDAKVFVDEFFPGQTYPNFYAATTSAVTVVT